MSQDFGPRLYAAPRKPRSSPNQTAQDVKK